MNRRHLGLVALLAGAAIAVSGCGSKSETPGNTAGAQQIELVARPDLTYSSSTLSVRAGQPVALVLKNEDTVQLHDFTIMEIPARDVHGGNAAAAGDAHAGMDMGGMKPDVHVSVDPGKAGRVEFTPTAQGQYEYFCTVPGHKDAGMKGTLTVN